MIAAPRYNALHDLESIFWIALWFLCYYVPTTEALTWHGEDGNRQLDMAFTVFTEHYNMSDPPSNRQNCMTTDAGLLMVLDTIPSGFNHAKATMIYVRQHLERYYRQVENRPEFPEPYTGVPVNNAYVVLAFDEVNFISLAFHMFNSSSPPFPLFSSLSPD